MYREGKALRPIKAELERVYGLKTALPTLAKSLRRSGVKIRRGYSKNPAHITRMERHIFHLPKDLYERLKQCARGRFPTVAEYLRAVLVAEVEREELSQHSQAGKPKPIGEERTLEVVESPAGYSEGHA